MFLAIYATDFSCCLKVTSYEISDDGILKAFDGDQIVGQFDLAYVKAWYMTRKGGNHE